MHRGNMLNLCHRWPLSGLFQLKPELMPTADMGHFGRKMKGVVVSSSWDRSKEEHGEKDGSVKQPTANEPTRIKIFEGG